MRDRNRLSYCPRHKTRRAVAGIAGCCMGGERCRANVVQSNGFIGRFVRQPSFRRFECFLKPPVIRSIRREYGKECGQDRRSPFQQNPLLRAGDSGFSNVFAFHCGSFPKLRCAVGCGDDTDQ